MKIRDIIILVTSAGLLFGGYNAFKNPARINEIVLISDITDQMLAKPKAGDVLSLFDLKSNIWNGCNFRYVDITDVSYNRTFSAGIEVENELLGNKFKRAERVKQLDSSIHKIISDATKEEVGKDNSIVFYPIARELNRLSQSKANSKVLIIYSDLMENTDSMSFYDEATFSLFKTNPARIKKYFDSQMKLNKLNGIKVFLIYQPVDITDDKNYRIVAEFYMNLLKEKGATVEIMASME